MRKTKLFVLVSLCAVVMACAVTKAPQINPETQWRLNTVSQLTDLQNDYLRFFKDVGDAQRAGILNADQVASLVAIGNRAKPVIESANREWKAYAAAPSSDKRQQITNLLLEGTQIMLEATTSRSTMGGQ